MATHPGTGGLGNGIRQRAILLTIAHNHAESATKQSEAREESQGGRQDQQHRRHGMDCHLLSCPLGSSGKARFEVLQLSLELLFRTTNTSKGVPGQTNEGQGGQLHRHAVQATHRCTARNMGQQGTEQANGSRTAQGGAEQHNGRTVARRSCTAAAAAASFSACARVAAICTEHERCI